MTDLASLAADQLAEKVVQAERWDAARKAYLAELQIRASRNDLERDAYAERVAVAEKERDEWEERYEALLAEVGGVWPRSTWLWLLPRRTVADLSSLTADQLAEKVRGLLGVHLPPLSVYDETLGPAEAALAELQTRANQRDDAIRRAEGSDRFNVEATQTIRALTRRVEAAEKERDEAVANYDAKRSRITEAENGRKFQKRRADAAEARLAERDEYSRKTGCDCHEAKL